MKIEVIRSVISGKLEELSERELSHLITICGYFANNHLVDTNGILTFARQVRDKLQLELMKL